jgi:DNA polymerase-3 subunit gamma/tau
MEMDAASRTGVGDIRETIDSVNYRAASARYKIYIIDEVHMLSTNAFNALLKTLEEPPAHVKFIFATTEIRKIPVTVLSRCQRFDLRRIEPDMMVAFLKGIAAREDARLADDALALIARASEGSVRDALSLLEQAIAQGAEETTAEAVRSMLGLADRGRVLDLFALIMKGEVRDALGELAAQYAAGGDPVAILRDLAEVTHWVSVVKISPEAAKDPAVAPDERRRGGELAGLLPMRALSRMWQMLLKALDEVALAPNPMMAAEMAVIRLTHVADLPGPEDLVRRLQEAGPVLPLPGGTLPAGGSGGHLALAAGGAAAPGMPALQARAAPQPRPDADSAALARFRRFEDVVTMIRARRDPKLLIDVEQGLHLVSYAPGRIEFRPGSLAPADLAARLGSRLQEWTGRRWAISVVFEGGASTLAERESAARTDLHARVSAHPLVAAALQAFPGARIRDVIRPELPATGDGADGADWSPFDPFEED